MLSARVLTTRNLACFKYYFTIIRSDRTQKHGICCVAAQRDLTTYEHANSCNTRSLLRYLAQMGMHACSHQILNLCQFGEYCSSLLVHLITNTCRLPLRVPQICGIHRSEGYPMYSCNIKVAPWLLIIKNTVYTTNVQ